MRAWETRVVSCPESLPWGAVRVDGKVSTDAPGGTDRQSGAVGDVYAVDRHLDEQHLTKAQLVRSPPLRAEGDGLRRWYSHVSEGEANASRRRNKAVVASDIWAHFGVCGY